MVKVKKIKDESGFNALLLLTIITLLTGTIFYHYVEGWKWIDSLYFSMITLTTIGYGDFVPTTDISKIFTMFYIVVGIGIILGFVNIVARKRFVKENENFY